MLGVPRWTVVGAVPLAAGAVTGRYRRRSRPWGIGVAFEVNCEKLAAISIS